MIPFHDKNKSEHDERARLIDLYSPSDEPELQPPMTIRSLLFNLLLPLQRRAWRCHCSDVEWEDDGVPGPAKPSGGLVRGLEGLESTGFVHPHRGL
jgi:hypothetical protein